MSGHSVLLVDDEALLRQSLAIILAASPSIGLVEQVPNGIEAVEALGSFDIVVLDYDMPGEDGLVTAQHILRRSPEQAILMLTRFARPGLLRQSLAAGVRGFLTKAAAPGQVVDAIQQVLTTGRYVDADVAIAAVANDCPLTERELDVLRLTGRGFTARRIASVLHLAPGTVRNYVSAALFKTHTARKEDAVEYARSRNWI